MRYSITATLGPSTAHPGHWTALSQAGAGRFRLNVSHLSPEETEVWLRRIVDAFSPGESPPVIVDLQGSKWRIGDISPRHLSPGDSVTLAYRPDNALENSLPGVFPVPHRDFFRALETGDGRVLVNDARVELAVETVREYQAFCRVLRGDHLEPRKGLTIPGSEFRTEGLQERDREVVRHAKGFPNVSFALSYVRDSMEMKRFCRDLGEGSSAIAKIERRDAVDDAERIAAVANEVWLCRGDLGAELGLRQMAQAVYDFTQLLPSLHCRRS